MRKSIPPALLVALGAVMVLGSGMEFSYLNESRRYLDSPDPIAELLHIPMWLLVFGLVSGICMISLGMVMYVMIMFQG